MFIHFVRHRQLPVIVEHRIVVEWVRTIVFRSVVVTVTVLSDVTSLVAKDEVDKGFFNPSVKCDVSILLDNSSLLCVRDCEWDNEEESERDCEGESEGNCEEVGEGDEEEIAGSSVDEKRDYISWLWAEILGSSNTICENTIHCKSGLTTIQIKGTKACQLF